ncbi:unnamed protein product [Amoebophrya sp. A120]|nr:unnamed protein product [Amoebophrya sp. A120]|eukprot:GSA120T00015232001.1
MFSDFRISDTVKFRDLAKYLILYFYGGIFLDADIELLHDPTELFMRLSAATSSPSRSSTTTSTATSPSSSTSTRAVLPSTTTAAVPMPTTGTRGKSIIMDDTTAVIYSEPRHPFWIEMMYHIDATIYSEVQKQEPAFAVKTNANGAQIMDASMIHAMNTAYVDLYLCEQTLPAGVCLRKNVVSDMFEKLSKSQNHYCNGTNSSSNSSRDDSAAVQHVCTTTDRREGVDHGGRNISISSRRSIHYCPKYYQFSPRTLWHAYERSVFGVYGSDDIFFLPWHNFNPLQLQFNLWKSAAFRLQAELRRTAVLRQNRTLRDEIHRQNAIASQRAAMTSIRAREDDDSPSSIRASRKSRPFSCASQLGWSPSIWKIAVDVDRHLDRKEAEQQRLLYSSTFKRKSSSKGTASVSSRGTSAASSFSSGAFANFNLQQEQSGADASRRSLQDKKDQDTEIDLPDLHRAWLPRPKLQLLLRTDYVGMSEYLFSHHDCYGGSCAGRYEDQCWAIAAYDRGAWLQEDQPAGFLKYYGIRGRRQNYWSHYNLKESTDTENNDAGRGSTMNEMNSNATANQVQVGVSKRKTRTTTTLVSERAATEPVAVHQFAEGFSENGHNISRAPAAPAGSVLLQDPGLDVDELPQRRRAELSFVELVLRRKSSSVPIHHAQSMSTQSHKDEVGALSWNPEDATNQRQYQTDADPVRDLYYMCESKEKVQGEAPARRPGDASPRHDDIGESSGARKAKSEASRSRTRKSGAACLYALARDSLGEAVTYGTAAAMRDRVYAVHHFDGSWLPAGSIHNSDDFSSRLQLRAFLRRDVHQKVENNFIESESEKNPQLI